MFWHIKVREGSIFSGRPRGDNSFNMIEHAHHAVDMFYDLMVYAPKGEGQGSRLRERVSFGKRAKIAVVIFLAISILLSLIAIQSWFFGLKVEGWWMQEKAGINIWDVLFERGMFWRVLLLFPLLFALSDPIFWRDRITLRLSLRMLLKKDSEKATFKDRVYCGLPLIILRAFLGFLIALVIGHRVAQQLLFVDTYIKAIGSNWLNFVIDYFRTIAFWLTGNIPNLSYLLNNTAFFDFYEAVVYLLAPVLFYRTIMTIIDTATHDRFKTLFLLPRRLFVSFFFWFLLIFVLQIPLQSADVTTPTYMLWRLLEILIFAGITALVLFSTRRKTIIRHSLTFALIGILLLSFLAPVLQTTVQYRMLANWDASKNKFEFPYRISPHISYTKWASNLDSIDDLPLQNVTAPEESILENVRIISYTASLKQMVYSYGRNVGVPWMKISVEESDGGELYGPMTVWSNKHEYWVCPTSPVLPEQTDVEVGRKFLYTHSEIILALDASSGEPVPMETVYPGVNSSKIAMYYGIGGLFREQPTVFIGIGNWNETHMSSFKGALRYDGIPDYVFGDTPVGGILQFVSERFWYFLSRGDIAFALGQYGSEIKVLQYRDVVERVSRLLVKNLELEKEPTTNSPIPYLVSDEKGNLYYAFATYINKPLYTGYANTYEIGNVVTSGDFRRSFAIILVNAYDGEVSGYRYGNWEENYITRYFAEFYPNWNKTIPEYIAKQIRYPKSLMKDVIDIYNTYHIDANDWNSWYKTLNIYDFPVDKSWNYFDIKFDDIRYVPISLTNDTKYAAVRIVELYQQRSEQWVPRKVVGMYVFMGDGKMYFTSLNSLSLQILLDSINSNREIQFILTTTRQRGEQWEEGNLIMNIINRKPIFFIPFYSITSTLMKVTMVVAVDGTTGDVGYYLLSTSPPPEEIRNAALRAYSNIKQSGLQGDEEKITAVKTYLEKNNLTTIFPSKVSPAVTIEFFTVKFTEKWEDAVDKFTTEVCLKNNISKVYLWTETEDSQNILNVGALNKETLEMTVLKIKLAS